MIPITAIGTMILAQLMTAIGAILLKKGTTEFEFKDELTETILTLISNYKLILGAILYFVAAIILILVLRSQQLNLIYALTSLGYVFVMILSIKALEEEMTKYKFISMVLIVLGSILISI